MASPGQAADATYQPKIQERNQGDELHVASGGILQVENGGQVDFDTTAKISFAGTDQRAALAAAVAAPIAGVAAGYKIARGQATTASASDTVVTGLATVVAAVGVLEDAPVIGCTDAQAVIGDQAGAPAAGSILIKTWKPTATNDATPTAATTTGKKVNWIAVGT
jgi:hypothetical protein